MRPPRWGPAVASSWTAVPTRERAGSAGAAAEPLFAPGVMARALPLEWGQLGQKCAEPCAQCGDQVGRPQRGFAPVASFLDRGGYLGEKGA